MKKTHKVIDLTYHEDEGNEAFDGTEQECHDFVAEQGGVGWEVVPMLKEEIELHPDNQKKGEPTPADFCVYPWSSVTKNSESETVAVNIMKILKRNGNTWRELPFEEYEEERKEDGDYSEREKYIFEGVRGYCKSVDTATLFSKTWTEIVTK